MTTKKSTKIAKSRAKKNKTSNEKKMALDKKMEDEYVHRRKGWNTRYT